jgi:hypothetical protein
MIEADAQILISAIKPEMLDMMWYKLAPLVEKAIEHSNDELNIVDIYDRLMAREMLLLVVTEGDAIMAAITLETRTFPSGKKVMNITTAGGSDMHLWVDKVLDIAEVLAVEQKCSDVYIIGRKGWERKLKTNGYAVAHTVLTKKVGE